MKVFALLTSLSASTTILAAPAAYPNIQSGDGTLRTLTMTLSSLLQHPNNRLGKRQSLDGQLGMLTGAVNMLPELQPFKTEEISPQTGRTGAKRIKLYYGPFKMLGANVSP
jgi:hypothetical protein